jgi:hypothetical protein
VTRTILYYQFNVFSTIGVCLRQKSCFLTSLYAKSVQMTWSVGLRLPFEISFDPSVSMSGVWKDMLPSTSTKDSARFMTDVVDINISRMDDAAKETKQHSTKHLSSTCPYRKRYLLRVRTWVLQLDLRFSASKKSFLRSSMLLLCPENDIAGVVILDLKRGTLCETTISSLGGVPDVLYQRDENLLLAIQDSVSFCRVVAHPASAGFYPPHSKQHSIEFTSFKKRAYTVVFCLTHRYRPTGT